MTTKHLVVKVMISPEKEVIGEGDVQLYSTVEDIVGELGDPESAQEIIDLLNFALEGKERTKIRNRTVSANAGPEKAIENIVKNFMKAREAVGKPITENEAREMVKTLGLA